MGCSGFNRQWARHAEQQWQQHRGPWGSPWGGGRGEPWSGSGRPGHPGPPPWVAGLFGLAQGERQRGPRARRGDVRAAILDVVRGARAAGEEINGYQVIQQIAERSNGAWRPSPGSVYPTISQLEDEGLLETDEGRGRRTLRLTAEGEAYVEENAEELGAVWAPFEEREAGGDRSGFSELKPEIGQVMGAVWQVITNGSERQRREAAEVLADTRRRLYGLLADGDPVDPEDPEEQEGAP